MVARAGRDGELLDFLLQALVCGCLQFVRVEEVHLVVDGPAEHLVVSAPLRLPGNSKNRDFTDSTGLYFIMFIYIYLYRAIF